MKDDGRPAPRGGILSRVFGLISLSAANKITGFLRGAVIAAMFGISGETDAFQMAVTCIALFYGPLNSFQVGVVPGRAGMLAQGDKAGADAYTSAVVTVNVCFAACVSAVLLIFTAPIVSLLAPGFEGDQKALAVLLTRLCVPVVLMNAVISVCNGVFVAHKKLNATEIASGAGGILWLAVILILAGRIGVYALAAGYLTSFLIHLVTAVFLLRGVFRYRPNFNWRTPQVKATVMMSIPLFLESMAGQINQIIDKMLASGLPAGSITALSYSAQIVNIVEIMIAGSVATVFFSEFAQMRADGAQGDIRALLRKGCSTMTAFFLPVTAGAMLFGREIIQVLYQRGAFDAADTRLTGDIFFFYAMSLPFMGLSGMISRCFYAHADAKTPIIATVSSFGVNIALNIALIGPMGAKGLALATALSHAYLAALMLLLARRAFDRELFQALGPDMLKSAAASAAMLAAVLPLRLLLAAHPVAALAAGVAAGACVYGGGLLLLRHGAAEILRGRAARALGRKRK